MTRPTLDESLAAGRAERGAGVLDRRRQPRRKEPVMAKEKLDYTPLSLSEQREAFKQNDPVQFVQNDPNDDPINAGIGFTQEEEVTEATDDATEEATDGE
jgi:hypothetical protein